LKISYKERVESIENKDGAFHGENQHTAVRRVGDTAWDRSTRQHRASSVCRAKNCQKSFID